MSIAQEIQFESGLLTVQVRGEFSLKEAKRTFLEILEAVAKYKAEKILIDGRNVKGKPHLIDRFYYGEFAANETTRLVIEIGVVPRFAYVLHEPLRDPEKFGELVARNRGMKIKVVETLEDAFEWLEVSSPKRMNAGEA